MPLNGVQEKVATLSGMREEYLKGVTMEGMALLDIARILADPALVVEEEV